MDSRTLTARWVFPVSGPPLEGGLVTVRGDRIEVVEPHGTRSADDDLGDVALIPGLVNAHTHLDLSGARGLIPPTSPDRFTDWLRGVIAFRRSRSAEQVQVDVRAGLAECLRFGTTLVGDIAADGQTWDELAVAPLRAVVFREMIGLSEERAEQAEEAAGHWWRGHPATTTTRPGLSPHAPYSASAKLMLSVTSRDMTAAVHLAESPGELELIAQRSGPFVEFLERLGVWDAAGLVRSLSWILTRWRLAGRALFVHCNYLPLADCRYIAGLHSIVYCPRTHAAFGHPPHPFVDFLTRGVRVCLGTDSLASNPDLDPLAEARHVARHRPDVPLDIVLEMVTLRGAEALGWADECGSLDAGKSADLVAVPLPNVNDGPYELLLGEDADDGPRRTMFRGEWR